VMPWQWTPRFRAWSWCWPIPIQAPCGRLCGCAGMTAIPVRRLCRGTCSLSWPLPRRCTGALLDFRLASCNKA
jgi:hypothetical protein